MALYQIVFRLVVVIEFGLKTLIKSVYICQPKLSQK